MASDQKFVDFIIDQVGTDKLLYKKMFGEYGLYYDGKLVGLVCDNKLFIKPTHSGREFINDVVEAPPYPGAKPSFLIEDKLEDHAWLKRLIIITADELAEPKVKKKSKSKKA